MTTDPVLRRKEREFSHHQIILSVDLGKRQDFTAMNICETARDARKNGQGQYYDEVVINVRDIQRLPLGTGYDEIARHIYSLFNDERLNLYDPKKKVYFYPTLLVDIGGVGDGVADILRRIIGKPFVRYQLVRGSSADREDEKHKFTVARTVLFQQLYAAFNNDRVHVDPRLKLAKPLISELRNLQVERNEDTGAERVVHREGEHDDMSICLASTVWWVERWRKPRPRILVMSRGEYMLRKGLLPPDQLERARRLEKHGIPKRSSPPTPIRIRGKKWGERL